jgi:hypothetical protein
MGAQSKGGRRDEQSGGSSLSVPVASRETALRKTSADAHPCHEGHVNVFLYDGAMVPGPEGTITGATTQDCPDRRHRRRRDARCPHDLPATGFIS